MGAHTPGPWEVVADHPQNACLKIQPVNRQYGGDEVATIYGGQDDCRCVDGVWTEQPIRDANARLIAAAPELLAALEYLMEMTEPPERNCACHLSPPCGWCTEYAGVADAHDAAERAIAKARGQ